jgi:hypothetical protein
VPILRSHEDWLAPLAEGNDQVFDALSAFLVLNDVVDVKAFNTERGLLG